MMIGPSIDDTDLPAPSVKLRANVAPHINLAFQVNSIPAVGEIEIANETDGDFSDVAISITSEPAFLKPKALRLDRLRAGDTRSISPVDVDLDPAFLNRLTEAADGEIRISVRAGDESLAAITIPCRALAPTEWTGLSTPPELVAAFVRPNDPAVEVILRNAAEKLRLHGRNSALDGYAGNRKGRSWEVAEAIWAALVDAKIVYALPPSSFEQDGQKIRMPGAILERKLGTCLDLTLLYAACLEQAGLNPIVGFVTGHAFCGLWLTPDAFSSCVVDEAETVRKRLQLQEMILIETTLLTNHPPLKFRTAVDKAASYANEDEPRRFELVVDIAQARQRRIRPLGVELDGQQDALPVTAEAGESVGLDEPPSFMEEAAKPAEPDQPLDRVEQWKRKLLDLSLRNRLLNFKSGKSAVDLFCPDAGALEDRLASGDTIKILATADVMSGDDPRDAEVYQLKAGEDAARQHALEALLRGEVLTALSDDELQDRLTEIHHAARSSLEESGANSLHLAIGFLSWSPAGKDQRCRAPLLLVPVRLERRTIRSGFRLVRHDDDARINPTLLQMLRQDFGLDMPEFERDLPSDASGLDVAQIWRIARQQIKDMKGFELTEEVTLSNFSFAKYLMWKDLVDRAELLKRNAVVRHLIDTPKDTYGDPRDMPEERALDREIHPKDLFMPLLADSSQTAAVVAASRAKDFVLFGPPGTGKSQTIANMIAQLLGDGRSVLFVSQKTTALEVVRKRLNDIGLGSFCLEVHSAKAQKTAVLAQLKTAWESRAADAANEWDAATGDLKALRDKLNEVVLALHRRHGNGLSVHKALGRVIAHRDFAPKLKLSFASPDQHDQAAMRALRDLCRSLRTAVQALGTAPANHPLKEIGHADWSPVWRGELEAACGAFRKSVVDLSSAGAVLAKHFGTSETEDPHRLYSMIVLAALAFKPEAQDAAALTGRDIRALKPVFEAWRKDRAACDAARARLANRYRDAVFSLDLGRLMQDWRDALAASFLTRNGRKKRVWDALAPFTNGDSPEDVGAEIVGLMELKEARAKAMRHDATLGALGAIWQGLETDPARVEAAFAWLAQVTDAAASLANTERDKAGWLACIAALILDRPDFMREGGRFATDAGKTLTAYKAFQAVRKELVHLAHLSDDYFGLPRSAHWLREAASLAETWEANAPKTQRWCDWLRHAAAARARGLAPLIDALTAGNIVASDIDIAFEVAYARWWVEQTVHRDALLRGFVSNQHEDAIARFIELDHKVAQLARHVVVARLSGAVPARNAFGQDPEFGVLSREIEKRARHMPLRRLFSQLPNALTALTPCVMMSPLSVAQFLPADSQPFDVVIFDEASQIPVWDAIGAIARGKQVVVAGDPKQLPPTSFFDRGSNATEDASEVEDLESILDECLAANIPSKRLAWHYRSRHESLIAFSNEKYYDGSLVTFPSPVTEDRAVRFMHVPDGVYERGSGRVNRQEAHAVVADVVRRLSDPAFAASGSSLGIVTFNGEQQRLIETLLDKERREKPELERFFGAEWSEPVFVKNLENVQGDERDVILFSIAYGPDQAGKVSVQISTLNKDGGTRRLNVAITRARSELVVFATLRPDQIDLSRTKAAGIRDFKHFLEYAERGPRALATASEPLGDTESPFEDAVKKALEQKGWQVHPQVGVSGFRVDLGVVHPDAPGRYLAGVECDGATYHRSATARDRDRLREGVLRNLGWRILRVWSTDWWVDPDSAFAHLNARLTEHLECDRTAEMAKLQEIPIEAAAAPVEAVLALISDTPPDDAPSPPESAVPAEEADAVEAEEDAPPQSTIYAGRADGEQLTFLVTDAAGYRAADLAAAGFAPDRDGFYETWYRPTLRKMVAHVIETEGPVFDDVLVRRIARAHGFDRAAGRIRETVLDVIERRFPRSTEDGRKIYWPENADKSRLPRFRASSAELRDHTDIPLPELAALAERFLAEGAKPDEAAIMLARHMGIGRLREAARERFLAAAHHAVRYQQELSD
ncbi:putative DNA helicase [Rhodomicrobium vannielii ATCC 17100]|uniref:Putative DNA helicase n=1 Tax=Rhodomicrobium vannielii (strain ATCC 17100 / DSM 162 / LMG 4299 / NCIMB 10020 / ATH 3.1.1) TaxID=648757 RepID=E3I6Y8_RHOVT|nr:DUF3320 domain-containing protein [Rhodomicrobium vannielii]ADP69553.1 putative DNA helicase [Rhodomicrobium vannielii ATCC 17100]